MHGVSLLPEEFGGAQKRTGGFFPPDHIDPLVIELGKVSVGMNDVLEVLAEQRFGGGTHAQPFRQLVLSAHCDPGALRRKALHMILLLLQKTFGNEHGHIDILVSQSLEPGVQVPLNVFPNGISVGTDDHTALHA